MAGDFSPRPIRPVGVSSWCRPCHARYRRDPSFREQQRQATEQRRRPARVASHKRCSKCGALKPLTAFSPRNNRPSQRQSSCKDCQAARVRAAYAQSGELGRVRQAARAKAYARTLKQQVYDHYGNSCACCGSIDNLTIDHVATGAGRDFSSRRELYYWLIKSRFPPGIQVLCVSCNTSKGCGKACRLNHGPQRRRSLLECPDCGWQPVGDLKWKPEDRLRMHRRRAHEVCNISARTAPGREETYLRTLRRALRLLWQPPQSRDRPHRGGRGGPPDRSSRATVRRESPVLSLACLQRLPPGPPDALPPVQYQQGARRALSVAALTRSNA